MRRAGITIGFVVLAGFMWWLARPQTIYITQSQLESAVAGAKTSQIVNGFLGQIKQVRLSVKTSAYQGAGWSLQYPAEWSTYPAGGMVGFGPGAPEHQVYMLGATKEQAEQKISAAEQAAGRKLEQRGEVAAPAGTSTKLMFGGSYLADKYTYYLFPYIQNTQYYIFVLRLHGPGNEALDAAGSLMLRTLELR